MRVPGRSSGPILRIIYIFARSGRQVWLGGSRRDKVHLDTEDNRYE